MFTEDDAGHLVEKHSTWFSLDLLIVLYKAWYHIPLVQSFAVLKL